MTVRDVKASTFNLAFRDCQIIYIKRFAGKYISCKNDVVRYIYNRFYKWEKLYRISFKNPQILLLFYCYTNIPHELHHMIFITHNPSTEFLNCKLTPKLCKLYLLL